MLDTIINEVTKHKYTTLYYTKTFYIFALGHYEGTL